MISTTENHVQSTVRNQPELCYSSAINRANDRSESETENNYSSNIDIQDWDFYLPLVYFEYQLSYNMSVNGVDPYHQFLALHKNQLESSVVPEHFWPTLFKKTTEDVSWILFIFKPILLYILKHKSFYLIWSVIVTPHLFYQNWPDTIFILIVFDVDWK